MRSCEYLKVRGPDPRKTAPLRKRNFQFFHNNMTIPHSSPDLHKADCITITFEKQKNKDNGTPITHWATYDPISCPVLAAAKVIRRLAKVSNSDETFIYSYLDEHTGKEACLSSPFALLHLRSFIRTLPPHQSKTLGFTWLEIGLHSIRSSAAMAMFLNHVDTTRIRLLGRWKSEAFLDYIRVQVREFAKHVASQMIQRKMWFHTSARLQCPKNPALTWSKSGSFRHHPSHRC